MEALYGEELDLGSMFTEPPRPSTPEPTIATYIRPSTSKGNQEWSELTIRLVGSHPLWGHYLWNAARSFANYLDQHADIYRGKRVLELGAGGGLPSLIAALNGARSVVMTDYPDQALLDNMLHNRQLNLTLDICAKVEVKGYVWGTAVQPLLSASPLDNTCTQDAYDVIILSDLIFNHSQHNALLQTCEQCIRRPPGPSSDVASVLVFYTHHRPHLAERDLEFFSKAKIRGWKCEEIVNEKYPPMFPEDPGEEEIRSTVHGWRLVREQAIP